MLKFGYSDWVLEHISVFGVVILPITFYFLYKVMLLEESKTFKTLSVIGVFIIMFVVVPSVSFIFLADEYIHEYREEFKGYIERMERYAVRIDGVSITNNDGNHIPKFSAKDEHKYVSIEYEKKGEVYNRIVKAEPYKVKGDEYRLSFAYVKEDYRIEYSKYGSFLMGVRKALGYKDDYKLVFEKGSYDFALGVPEDDFEEVREEMQRKAK